MNLVTRIKSSVTIIKTHTIVLLITALVCGLNILNSILVQFKHISWMNIPVFIATFIVTLVMYGVYYEIIEDKYSSMNEIFSKYAYGYFIVSIIIVLPVILFSLLLSLTSLGTTYQSVEIIIPVLFSILFMYVVPYFFHTKKIVDSFKNGIGFLIGNFQKSLPLITVVFLFYVFKFSLGSKLATLASANANAYLFALAQYIFIFSLFIFDYMLFVILILTITNKEIKV